MELKLFIMINMTFKIIYIYTMYLVMNYLSNSYVIEEEFGKLYWDNIIKDNIGNIEIDYLEDL